MSKNNKTLGILVAVLVAALPYLNDSGWIPGTDNAGDVAGHLTTTESGIREIVDGWLKHQGRTY